MTRRDKTDVLIIGAGPAGLVMAMCLAKCGIHSLVIERQFGINPHPKAHELNTRSLEILESLGVSMAALRAEASPKEDGCRIAFCTSINEEFGSIDLLKDTDDPGKYQRHLASDEPYLNISQTEVERVIRQHVDTLPEIDLRLGHEWQSSHEEPGKTVCSIKNRQDDYVYEIEAGWIIAADGAGSRVRQSLGIKMNGPEKIQDFKNAYFELNLREHIQRPAKLYWIFEPAAFGTFIAHHIDKRWVYNVPIYEPWESAEDYTDEVLSKRIAIALGLKDTEIEIKSTSVWRMTVQTAETWRAGNVFLVGDAAHRFPPTGGLGMNSGIGDVHNLAWKLAQVIRGQSPPDLLDTYEVERKPVAERNAAESYENFQRMFDVIQDLGLPPNGAERAARANTSGVMRVLPGALKSRILNMINGVMRRRIRSVVSDEVKSAKLRATIGEQIPHFDRIGLDLGYIYDSAGIVAEQASAPDVVVTKYQPSCRPGARFPHMWLNPETGAISSHSLLDYGCWTVLKFGEGASLSEAAKSLIGDGGRKDININALDVPPSGKAALLDLCDAGQSGAVLIRPDGHVAWRSAASARREDLKMMSAPAPLGAQPKAFTAPPSEPPRK